MNKEKPIHIYQRTCELPDVQFFLQATLNEYLLRSQDGPTLHEIRQRIIKEFKDIKDAGVVFLDDGSMIKEVVFDWDCWSLHPPARVAFEARYRHEDKPFKPEFLISFKRFDGTCSGLPWVFSIV